MALAVDLLPLTNGVGISRPSQVEGGFERPSQVDVEWLSQVEGGFERPSQVDVEWLSQVEGDAERPSQVKGGVDQ
jgi:hypothetical protein